MSVLGVLLPLAVDAAVEGRKIIIGMTLTGLSFLAVILIGDLLKWRAHRRLERELRR